MNIVMDKPALVLHLTKVLEEASVEDARLKKKHEADEAKALGVFHEKLKKALKMSYKEVKSELRSRDLSLDSPPCPSLQAPAISRELRALKLDSRKSSYTIQPDSDLGRAVSWLPESKQSKRTVCD